MKCFFIQLIYEQAIIVIPSKIGINYLDANLLLSDIEVSFFKCDDIMNNKLIRRHSEKINMKELYSCSMDENIETTLNSKKVERTMSVINDLNDFNDNEILSKNNQDGMRLTLGNKNLNLIEKYGLNDKKIYGLFD